IFRDLDNDKFQTRARAARELAALGVGASAGVRERIAKGASPEVRGRATEFLTRVESDTMTPERIRFLRGLEVLACAATPAARQLLEKLAAGAPGVWETEAARQALR